MFQMEISYQISWRRSSGSHWCNSTYVANGTLLAGEGRISCQYSCSGTIISPISYVCTYFSAEDDWSFGEHRETYLFNSVSDENAVTIGTVSGNWITDAGNDDWNISTTFSLAKRTDTGKINSSPRILPTPPLYLQQGCSYTIPLPVSDPDNDTVRCRWAVGNECSTICNKFPGAVLDSATCTITYTANNGTGIKAVAIMIEDFAPRSPYRPLSSVALQFLVLVSNSSQLCSTQTTFVSRVVLISHPSSLYINLTQTATFTCDAIGFNVSYQWRIRSGSFPSKVTGINSNTLVIPDVRSSDDNTYTCVASNQRGSVSSNAARLVVTGMYICMTIVISILHVALF